MLRRSTLAAAALSAALAATACRDSLAPSPGTGAPSLATITKMGQCFALEAVVASSEVAPGAYDPTLVVAPDGKVVTRAAVQAGSSCWLTPSGATGSYTILVEGAPCYLVEGLGTGAVTLLRIGASPTCKNITHVEYVTGPAPPSIGKLVICESLTGAEIALVPVFDFVVTGASLPSPIQLAIQFGTCSDPTDLPAGSYLVSVELFQELVPVVGITALPDGRLFNPDYAARSAEVAVVGGSTTTVTFTHYVPPDPTS